MRLPAPRPTMLLRDSAGPATEVEGSGMRQGCSACGWDAFVESCAGDNLVQTEAWAKARRLLGFDTRNIVLRERGAIVGGAQLVIKPQGELGAIGHVVRGPLLARSDRQLAARLLDEIEIHARAARVCQLTVQPPEGGEIVDAELRARGYGAAATPPAPLATLRLDLELCTPPLLVTLGRAGEEAGGGQADGGGPLAVALGDRDAVAMFHDLHRKTALRHRRMPLSLDHLLKTWDVLAPLGYLHLVLAHAADELVVGLWVSTFAGHVTTRLAGWRRGQPIPAVSEACDRWIIDWAMRRGESYYDLGGIERACATALIAGRVVPGGLAQSAIGYMQALGGTPVLFPQARAATLGPAISPSLTLGDVGRLRPRRRARTR